MFLAQNGCWIPLQRYVNYQCWAIPTYILCTLVRENAVRGRVIPLPLAKEYLTFQMRNPTDVGKIFFSKILPCTRNGSKASLLQMSAAL